MDQQLELLAKLLQFYKGRYQGTDLESKFNDACEDLINTGDLKRAVYIKFCIENDIEPRINKKVTPTPKSSISRFPNDDSSYSRSSC